MKKVKAIILNIFNEEVILKGYVKEDDLNKEDDFLKIPFYESKEDEDFFLIKECNLILI